MSIKRSFCEGKHTTSMLEGNIVIDSIIKRKIKHKNKETNKENR